MRLIVTGSRVFRSEWYVQKALDIVVAEHCNGDYSKLILVHGGCDTGADMFADRWARSHGLVPEVHPALWNKHFKSAGPIRNREMAKAGADLALVFWGDTRKGTTDMVGNLKRQNIPYKEFWDQPGDSK